MSDELFRSEQVSVSEAPGQSSASAKKFLLWLAIATAGLLTLVGLANTWIDAYGLYPSWHKKDLERGNRYLNNERYAKIQEFEAGSFDGVLIGGSRVAFQSSHDLDAVTGEHFYNYGINGLGLGELEAYANRIAETRSVKMLVIGLSFYSFSSKDREWRYIDRDTIEGTLAGRVDHFLSLNVSWDAVRRSMEVIDKTRRGVKLKFQTVIDIDPEGNRIHGPQTPEARKSGWPKVLAEYRKKYREYDYDPARLQRIARIRAHLQKAGIQVKFFVTPVSQDLLNLIKKNCPGAFDSWKKDLAKVTDYYDFCYSNSVTQNPENFFDPSHSKPQVGALMFRRMFASDSGSSDFGRWVPETRQ